MAKNDYPKWLYAAEGKSKLVYSEEEEAALQGEWHDSPAKTSDAAAVNPEPPPVSPAYNEGARVAIEPMAAEDAAVLRKRLEAEAKAIGLKVDKRWSNETLQRQIAEFASS